MNIKQHFLMVILTAALVPLLTALSTVNPAEIGDARQWAIGLLTGVVRSVAVAALAWWQASKVPTP